MDYNYIDEFLLGCWDVVVRKSAWQRHGRRAHLREVRATTKFQMFWLKVATAWPAARVSRGLISVGYLHNFNSVDAHSVFQF